MIEAGKLRHKVTLQALDATQNEYGEPSNTWEDVITVWASVEPLSGRELFSAQQVNAETTTKIRMRYRDEVTPETRILFKNKVYNIQNVINPEMRNIELILMCSEGLIADG